MKTRFLLIAFFTLISSVMIPVFAVPELDPDQAFEYSDYVVLGKIIAVDIISDPVIHKSEKTYSEKSGVALYDITVVKSYKNPDNRTLFTVPGYFLYEPHAMSYDTYPYEVGQTVRLYIQKNTDENVEGKLIIRSGDSRLVSDGTDPLCTSDLTPDGEGWVFINCNWEQYADVPVDSCLKGKAPANNYTWNSQDCLWEWSPLRNENSSGPVESEPEPERNVVNEINLAKAMDNLQESFDENVSFGPFNMKDVVVGYGIRNGSIIVDVKTKYYESEYLEIIKENIQEIAGDVHVKYDATDGFTYEQICGPENKLVNGICINSKQANFDTELNQILLFASIGVILSVVSFIIWRKRK